ncbi:MAG TPA: ATP-binding protein, partial [Oculatellaceae cyanobacterium]
EMLVADELRLRQMLVHLLSNAIKFTDPGGEIGLRVNSWEGWIAFTVWDTGIGIPAEKQHLIFQKFQQLEQPRTRRFEGTGLGLVLTQRLSRLHGGDVSFISKAGVGSEFTLLLPSCPPQAKGQELRVEEQLQVGRLKVNSSNLSNLPSGNSYGEQHSNLPSGNASGEQPSTPANRNHLVLIVETVPRYLESLTEQLNGLGYRVVIARSGPEAIEKARRLQPHTVLLNPLLPQLSGWDVLTLLKSDAQTQHIPVFVMATQAEKKQAYHNKADGFLSFPVQKQALLESLTGLRHNQRPTRSSLTILHLNPHLDKTRSDSSILSTDLTELLSFQHSELNYRVLEADDLDQAELLVRVWHPDIVLLDGTPIADPLAYLKQFSLHSGLTSLPLVTLDHQTTEAANQITDLCVYPCLAPDNSSKIAALVQVIEVAAGISRKPSILVMEVSRTQQELELSKVEDQKPNKTLQQKTRHRSSSDSLSANPHSSWLQALTQYLQTAGYRSLLSSSWEEAHRQIQAQSVDLLLIRLKDISDSTALVKQLIALEKLENLPPILVLDHRLDADRISPSAPLKLAANQGALPLDEAVRGESDSSAELESLLGSLATQILRGPSDSMTKLLDQIDWTLSNKGV